MRSDSQIVALSGVPATVTPSIVGSVAFTVIMAVVTIQILRNRAWFLWALTSASMREWSLKKALPIANGSS